MTSVLSQTPANQPKKVQMTNGYANDLKGKFQIVQIFLFFFSQHLTRTKFNAQKFQLSSLYQQSYIWLFHFHLHSWNVHTNLFEVSFWFSTNNNTQTFLELFDWNFKFNFHCFSIRKKTKESNWSRVSQIQLLTAPNKLLFKFLKSDVATKRTSIIK